MDELCDSFLQCVKTVDGEELDMLEEMMSVLETEKETIKIREYMNKVSYNMNRYYYDFIHDIFTESSDFSFLHEIKNAAERFRSMWVYFTENEKKLTDQSLFEVRDAALETFCWIRRSIEEYNERYEMNNEMGYETDNEMGHEMDCE